MELLFSAHRKKIFKSCTAKIYTGDMKILLLKTEEFGKKCAV